MRAMRTSVIPPQWPKDRGDARDKVAGPLSVGRTTVERAEAVVAMARAKKGPKSTGIECFETVRNRRRKEAL